MEVHRLASIIDIRQANTFSLEIINHPDNLCKIFSWFYWNFLFVVVNTLVAMTTILVKTSK